MRIVTTIADSLTLINEKLEEQRQLLLDAPPTQRAPILDTIDLLLDRRLRVSAMPCTPSDRLG